ncbi:inner membrane sensor for iron transport [Bordetella ansorpii]|uniref:Inner membrane sensor for iron transport n=1 Tax=Bordetella ansorpii TaxID=288768 RepID=A0A157P6B7_9BORD|nr:FecR family protein [Bordetella ansorpii]SAI28971.1 inner membrane sensor for iron transport [Bordetella ansorpii]
MPPIDSGPSSQAANAAHPPRDASEWFARMQSGEVTEADHHAFDAWLNADPSHEREYRRLVYLWRSSAAIPEARLRALAQDRPSRSAGPVPARRRMGLGLAAGCALSLVASLAGPERLFRPTVDAIDFVTNKGERRQISLADGSMLHLNSDTRLTVCFDAYERRVTLRGGEVFFDVIRDAARPFIVNGDFGFITATGTRFNARRDAQGLQVSVASGEAQLSLGNWPQSRRRRLVAGQQAVAQSDGSLSDTARVNVDNVVAWRVGKVIFNDMPLSAVIREMNRYLPQPANLATSDLGPYRISGVFNVDDPGAMIDALPAIAPVRVQHLADGRITVASR